MAFFLRRARGPVRARWRGGSAFALSLTLAACGAEQGGAVLVGAGGAGGANSAGGGQAGGGVAGGPAASDRDGDGVVDRADCAPDDPARSSLATGLYVDRDGDGFTAGGPLEACLGPEGPLGAGFASSPGGDDCDDDDPSVGALLSVYVDADADGFGAGEAEARCLPPSLSPAYATAGGDCAPDDPGRWRTLDYRYVDFDGDGATIASEGVICVGFEPPPWYAPAAGADDCDDNDPSAGALRPLFADLDGDGAGAGEVQWLCTGGVPAGYSTTGSDCAPDDPGGWQVLSYVHRDADGDGQTVPSSGALCAGASLPTGYYVTAQGHNCDDADPSVYVALTAYVDADGDQVGSGPGLPFCTAGAPPAGHSLAGGDCAPDDATLWQELAYHFIDADGDSATVAAEGTLCAGASLPPPYATTPSGNDCDDADPGRFLWAVLYPDGDGDGVGADPRQIECTDGQVPPGLSIYGDDVDDGDPAVFEDDDEDEELFALLF